MGNKGMSTLISTVLILGFTVIVGASVLTMGKFVYERLESDVDSSVGLSQLSFGEVSIRLNSARIGDNVVTLENTGQTPIEEITISGNGNTEIIDLSNTPQGVLNPFEVKTYDVSNGNVLSGVQILVIPAVSTGGGVGFVGAVADEITVTRSHFRVFVTSVNTYTGNLGGLGGADSICQGLADAQSLGGNWKAWLSAAGVGNSVGEGLYQSTISYKLLDGTTIASDWGDLIDGDILSYININEKNVVMFTEFVVYTGTDFDGTFSGAGDCDGWTTTTGVSPTSGTFFATDSLWTNLGTSGCGGSGGRRLYCFEQP